MFDLTLLGMGSKVFHDGTGSVQHPLPLKVIFLDTIFIYLHLVTQQRMLQIIQKYYAGSRVDGPPQVT